MCGRCVFNLPVTKTDPQALGKKRTHACACSTSAGSESMCPVKVARKLYRGAVHHGPVGAHPIPAMRPLWPSAGGQFITKSAATLTFQKLAALTGTDTRVTGHACRVTSGHLVDSSLLSVGLQGCIGVRSGLPLVLRNCCRCKGHEGIATHGGA